MDKLLAECLYIFLLTFPLNTFPLCISLNPDMSLCSNYIKIASLLSGFYRTTFSPVFPFRFVNLTVNSHLRKHRGAWAHSQRANFRKRVPSSYACSSKNHSDIWKRNEKEEIFKQYPTQVLGAQMVPSLTKPPCTEIRQDKRRYAEALDFKPFSHGVINIYEGL